MADNADAGTALEPVPSNKLAMNQDLDSMVQVAQLMAKAKIALPAHLHNAPGECLAIVMLARDWGMNPYAVGQKTSVISNRLMFEGQLVQAVANNAGILAERFNYVIEGEGEAMKCTCTALIKGDKEPKSILTGMPKNGEARNSPLWKSDPAQQLTYKATRIWVRRYAPEILMGVYTPEDEWNESNEMRVVNGSAVDQRIAALTSQPAEVINTIEGEAASDPFAEGALSKVEVSPEAAERMRSNHAESVTLISCEECGDKGIEGGCPSCGKEPDRA